MKFESEESLRQKGTYTWGTLTNTCKHTVAQTRKSLRLWCFEENLRLAHRHISLTPCGHLHLVQTHTVISHLVDTYKNLHLVDSHTLAQTRKSHPKTCLWCFENVGGHTHTDSGKKHVSHIPKHVSADILKKLKQPERQQIVIDDM